MTTDPCAELLGTAAGLACAGTLSERGAGPTVTTVSPGRAFRLDDRDGGGRRWLGLESTDPCADGAFWLPEPPPTVAVVELKSGSLGDATRQLQTAVKAMGRKLPAHGCDPRIVAVVCLSGSAPGGLPASIEAFRRATNRPLVVKSGLRRTSVRIQALLP